jgi:hypothetical protein
VVGGLGTALGVRFALRRERAYQPQESLLLRPVPGTEEFADLNVRGAAAGRLVGLVEHEHRAGRRVLNQVPAVAAGASVEFARVDHAA